MKRFTRTTAALKDFETSQVSKRKEKQISVKLSKPFAQKDFSVHNASIATSQKLKKLKYLDKIMDKTKVITLLTKCYDTKGIPLLTVVIA